MLPRPAANTGRVQSGGDAGRRNDLPARTCTVQPPQPIAANWIEVYRRYVSERGSHPDHCCAPSPAPDAGSCRDAAASCTLEPVSETSLYPIVKEFLEHAGFEVKGEVNGCDIVAVHCSESLRLLVVEMKLGLNLELLLQATDRLRAADEVWMAVLATRRGRDRDRRIHRLCRLLGLGLMAISLSRGRVEVLVEPGPYRPRTDQRRRKRLLTEHARRRGDPAVGGGSRQPVMTAYRQQALICAALLRLGRTRPRELRSAAPDAGRILLRNVYGWFERKQPGEYGLTELGEAALQRWHEMAHILMTESSGSSA
ncbi:MAG: hypothetical protein J2P47_12045 [Acetobacteraceae bacterium]|nr:hypothetical protein [Acetobacteraceae bacterium]